MKIIEIILEDELMNTGMAEGASNNLQTVIKSFVNSPNGQKYKKYDCKTVTRAFVQWAEQNKIPAQVISLAPPGAEFIKKNPQFQGKDGQGDGHIMPIVNDNAIDFTVRQFGIDRPFENPLVTSTNSLPAVYGKFGYFTDKPEWFLGGKSHWIGTLKSIPSEIFNQNFGDEILEQRVAEGLNQITEYRDRLLQYVKSLLPTWPEYVLKDWLVPNKGDFSNLPADALKNGIMEKLKGAGLTTNSKWQLVPDMKFTMDMFDPMTKQRLIGRAGGTSDLGMGIPKDKERHATQAALAQQQGGVRKEPVLLIKTAKGYELLEGWHRTIQHFVKYPDGYTGPAYVAVAQGQQGVAEGFSNAVTFFRGEPILSQERLNQLKSSIGKPYPILRKEGSAANIGTYMSPDGDKATSFVKQALAGQGKGGVVTQIQVNPNSFSKGDGGIDEAVIITNIAGLVSNQTPNKNDPLRIQDRKQAMLKYLGPGVKKYLNDPLLSDPKIVQSWYNPEFAQKNWNTINSGKQAVTKPGESNMQERMMRILGPLAENIRRDPEVINYFISHNPGDWVEYNFRMNSDGSGTKVVDVKYYPPAKQGVAEGSLTESAVFLNPTTVVVGQAHGQPLELSPDTLKKIQDIAAKHGAWYEGNGTDRSYTKGQIDRYVGSWDDEVAKTASPNDPKWLYVLFANVDENNRVKRVGVDPKDTIFNRLMDSAQDNSFQGIGYTARALQKFLQMASEDQYDFVKMSQQPATQENLTRFLKAGEALMWPSNWEQYPNRAGKIAKAATVDVRDQYLASRKAGVYVTGSGHLKAVQNITDQQGVAEEETTHWYNSGIKDAQRDAKQYPVQESHGGYAMSPLEWLASQVTPARPNYIIRKIVVIGDSIAVGIGQAIKGAVVNATVGINSSKILSNVSRDNKVQGAKLAIVSAGSNDIVKGKGNPQKLTANIAAIKDALNAEKYVWILPYDKVASQAVSNAVGGDKTVDLKSYPSSDGLHPSSYSDVAKAARAGLNLSSTAPGALRTKDGLQGVAEDQKINLDTDYFMNEGCGIFAVATALNEPGSQIYIISNKEGESWSKSFPYEITHVFANIPGKGQHDVRGKRSLEEMASDFGLDKGDYSVKGPFDPKEFFTKFMGNSDSKPLYGTVKDIKQVQKQIQPALKQGMAEGLK